MATTLKTSTNYKTITLSSIFSSNNKVKTTYVGTMPAGRTIQVSQIVSIGGTLYGQISGHNSPTYSLASNGMTATAVGKYIRASALTEVDSSNRATITAKTNSGTTNTISGVVILSKPTSYWVKTGYTWSVRSGPDVNGYALVKSYRPKSAIKVYATVLDSRGNMWASPSSNLNTWGLLRRADGSLTASLSSSFPSDPILNKTTNTTPVQTTPSANNKMTTTNINRDGTVTDASEDTYADQYAVDAVLKEAAQSMSYDDTESLTALNKMQYVIGIPPKITPTADIPYLKNASPSNNFGRCYTEMFMMGNTVFSIQPCKVKYLPGFNDDQKQSFWDSVNDAMRGSSLGDDTGLRNNDAGLTGQLFEGQPDYKDYINTVNLLARTIAIYLGIGDRKYMNTNIPYKKMDYSFYRVKKYSGGAANGLFSSITDPIRATIGSPVTSAINDDTFIHFYMTADGTSVSENLSVSTRQSGLESLFNNNLSEIAQEIQFLGGAAAGIDFQSAIDEASGSLNEVAGTMGTTIGNIVRYGGNYLRGGRLVFPQMLDDCTYDRSYRGTCRFISASGDTEAIFLSCYLPLCYLLPYVLPQMLTDNMYRYPFLARVNAKGLYHCDLAALTGLQIQRGGQDGTMFTSDGLPFEIDVSFDITPLYSKLMVTNSRHPILFLSNSALQEYLGAMCGVSFSGNQLELKINILKSITGNYLSDTIPSMLRGYYSSNVALWLRKLFTF